MTKPRTARLPIAIAVASILGFAGGAATAAQLSRQDQTFLNKAAAGGMAEVQAGQLGLKKAGSQETRQFAQMLVTDHTQANDQLMQIAQQQGMKVTPRPSRSDQSEMQDLQQLSGRQFDQTFGRNEVQDHEKTIALFEREAKSGSDPALRDFAQNTIPVLRKHLDMARTVAGGG